MILILDNQLDTRYNVKVPLEEIEEFDIIDGAKLIERADLVVVLDVVIGKMAILKNRFTEGPRIESVDKLDNLVRCTILQRALLCGREYG